MKPKTVGKITTVLAVTLIVLSGMMVLQLGVRADERKTGTVEGIIDISGSSSVPKGLEVTLKDLSNDQLIDSYTEKGGYFQFSNVDVGNYRLMFASQEYKEENVYFKKVSEVFTVEDQKSTYLNMEVETKPLEYILNGTVTDSNGEVVPETQIRIRNPNYDYSKTVTVMNETTGYFETPIFDGEFIIEVTSPEYPTYTTETVITSDTNLDITLNDPSETPTVSGYLWSDDGAVTTELQVTLYNQTEDRIFHTTVEEGPYFEIGATKGNYTLIVDSVGYLPKHEEIELNDSVEHINLKRIFVNESDKEYVNTTIDFTNFNNITVERHRTYQPDTRIAGLDYSYLGNLKMQIDLALGNGDLVLNYSELQEFNNEIRYRESMIESTQNLIMVDGTAYKMNKTLNWTLDLEGIESPGDTMSVFNTSADMNSYSNVRYISYNQIKTSQSYEVDLYLNQDLTLGNYRDYTYEIDLPGGYERTNTPGGVNINGFTTISIDPSTGTGLKHITLNVEESESGEADITLEIGPNVYLHEDEHYIVKTGTNVTCNADFFDPVGSEEDAIYEWFIGTTKIGEGQTINHVFDDNGEKNLNLEITETGGSVTTAETTVLVDGSAPQGDIQLDVDSVDEGEEFEVSAYSFTDNGEVSDYEWNFSDGSGLITGMNVTHIYTLKGTYTIQLNITDVVGNYEMYTTEIDVNDATKPVAKFTLSYEEDGEEVTIESANLTGKTIGEGIPVTLDAEDSYDPAGFEGERTDIESVNWWIAKDGYSEDLTEFDYNFESFGTYTISLNVTDEAGNYHNISREFEVTMGPKPNLEINNIKFSESPVRNGQTVTVTVNITNYGTANASNLNVFFKVGNEDIPVGGFTVEEDGEETDNVIPQDTTRMVKFEWSVDSGTGSKTISVNITDGNEPAQWQTDNAMNKDVTIEPPAWRRYIVYIIIPVVIVGVVVGLYYYRERY